MLKFVSILSAVIAVVHCQENTPPERECSKTCDATIKKAFETMASFGKKMEPIQWKDVGLCQKLILTTGPSTIIQHGKSCMITEPNPSKVHWLRTGFELKKLHLECHVAEFTDILKAVQLLANIPILKLSLPKISFPNLPFGLDKIELGNKTEHTNIIVVDGKDLVFDLVCKINFEDDFINVTKLELAKGKLDAIEVSLKGDSLLITTLNLIIAKSKAVRVSLGLVVQIVLRAILSKFIVDLKFKEVISMLNCVDTDF